MCSEQQDLLTCAEQKQEEVPVENAFTFLIKLLDEAEEEKKKSNQES